MQKSLIISENAENNRQKSPSKLDIAKLEEYSKKTGLSIETLKIIHSKSNAIKECKNDLNKTIQLEDYSKKL